MTNQDATILLTADRTLMSNYHGNQFLGFGTCAPSNFIPDVPYSYMFFPPLKTNKGLATSAPYGLRKIEAQLLKEGCMNNLCSNALNTASDGLIIF
jgi:hypothetical protein